MIVTISYKESTPTLREPETKMEGSPNPGRRDLPPSTSRSSSLTDGPRGVAASPTPLTGSEQLGWPSRKKNCHWVWLEQLVKQVLWLLLPPKAQSWGSLEHLKAPLWCCGSNAHPSISGSGGGLSSACSKPKIRTGAKPWQAGLLRRVVEP